MPVRSLTHEGVEKKERERMLSRIPGCYSQKSLISAVKWSMDTLACQFCRISEAVWTVLSSQCGLAEFISTNTLWRSLPARGCGEVAAQSTKSLFWSTPALWVRLVPASWKRASFLVGVFRGKRLILCTPVHCWVNYVGALNLNLN